MQSCPEKQSCPSLLPAILFSVGLSRTLTMGFLRVRRCCLPLPITLLAAASLLVSSAMSFQIAGRRMVRHGAFAGVAHSKRPRSASTTTARPTLSPASLPWVVPLAAIPQQEEVDPGVVIGTDLRVLKYPHCSLRAENAAVTDAELRDGSIAQVAKEMFLVMYAAQGVGLAAPQVGVNKRLMVYNASGDRKKWLDEVVMVNPVITEFSEALDVEIEGCLSFPDMNGEVERSKWIKVEALSLRGNKMKKKFTGWEARIFQHEYDHLDGVVYIDRLLPDSKTAVEIRLKELVEEHDAETYGGPAL